MKEFGVNNWAVILGGSSGLGLATAKKLAKHGLNICILHRDSRAQLDQVQKEFESIKSEGILFESFNVDATNVERRNGVIVRLTDVFGDNQKVKVLVHSLAKGNLKPMVSENDPELGGDDFELTIKAMAISLFDWTKAFQQANLFSDDARIISFTSEGNSKAWPNYAAVSAAKCALEAISRNIALEFAPHGIKSNCIQAGVTDTASLRMIPGSDRIIQHTLKRNPNKKLTTPKAVADAVYLLCREEAKWITGTVIPVDGGEHLS